MDRRRKEPIEIDARRTGGSHWKVQQIIRNPHRRQRYAAEGEDDAKLPAFVPCGPPASRGHFDERTTPFALQPAGRARTENLVRGFPLWKETVLIDDALRSQLHARSGLDPETGRT